MTSDLLVGRWRWRLAVAVGWGALLRAAAAGVLSWRLAMWAGLAELPAAVVATTLALALGGWTAWRHGVGRLDAVRVALWLEEGMPSVRGALLGAVSGGPLASRNDAAVDHAAVERAARRRVGRDLGWVAVPTVLVGGLALMLPAAPPRSLSGRESPPAALPMRNALGRVTVRVRPPDYTREADTRHDDPDVVRPLVGSTLTVEGAGAPPEIWQGEAPLRVERAADGWRAQYQVDSVPHLLRFARDGDGRRIAIDPLPDLRPVVRLELPARDTVVVRLEQPLLLRSAVADDHGIASSHFEWIVTSGDGGGERFTFRNGVVARTTGGGRATNREAVLAPSTLALAPGDVVHLRAVATDANPRGDREGVSDTRTLRVARPDEADSVAVEAAPPPRVDAPLLSQRMLIDRTEALLRRAPRLGAAATRVESARIGRDQATLRRQVSDLVFARLGDDPAGEHFHGDGHAHGDSVGVGRPLTPEELLRAADRATGARGALLTESHDETPLVAVSRPLLEAYNAMWDAGRALESGAPREALPAMYRALAAMQAARAAERLYQRGARASVSVDLSRVRLAARERGASVVVPAVPAQDPAGVAEWRRVIAALRQPRPADVLDSLLVVRVALAAYTEAALALDSVVTALRAGRSAEPSLAVLRLQLTGGVQARPRGRWGVTP